MTMDMADIIAAHSGYTVKMPNDPRAPFLLACTGCGDERPIINEVGKVRTPAQRHNTHVADELTKAGYGKLPQSPAQPAEPDLGPCPHPGACPGVCWGCA